MKRNLPAEYSVSENISRRRRLNRSLVDLCRVNRTCIQSTKNLRQIDSCLCEKLKTQIGERSKNSGKLKAIIQIMEEAIAKLTTKFMVFTEIKTSLIEYILPEIKRLSTISRRTEHEYMQKEQQAKKDLTDKIERLSTENIQLYTKYHKVQHKLTGWISISRKISDKNPTVIQYNDIIKLSAQQRDKVKVLEQRIVGLLTSQTTLREIIQSQKRYIMSVNPELMIRYQDPYFLNLEREKYEKAISNHKNDNSLESEPDEL